MMMRFCSTLIVATLVKTYAFGAKAESPNIELGCHAGFRYEFGFVSSMRTVRTFNVNSLVASSPSRNSEIVLDSTKVISTDVGDVTLEQVVLSGFNQPAAKYPTFLVRSKVLRKGTVLGEVHFNWSPKQDLEKLKVDGETFATSVDTLFAFPNPLKLGEGAEPQSTGVGISCYVSEIGPLSPTP